MWIWTIASDGVQQRQQRERERERETEREREREREKERKRVCVWIRARECVSERLILRIFPSIVQEMIQTTHVLPSSLLFHDEALQAGHHHPRDKPQQWDESVNYTSKYHQSMENAGICGQHTVQCCQNAIKTGSKRERERERER